MVIYFFSITANSGSYSNLEKKKALPMVRSASTRVSAEKTAEIGPPIAVFGVFHRSRMKVGRKSPWVIYKATC